MQLWMHDDIKSEKGSLDTPFEWELNVIADFSALVPEEKDKAYREVGSIKILNKLINNPPTHTARRFGHTALRGQRLLGNNKNNYKNWHSDRGSGRYVGRCAG